MKTDTNLVILTKNVQKDMKVERRGRKTKPGSLNHIRSTYSCIQKDEIFRNLSRTSIVVNAERWYNLDTNRAIKVIRGKSFLIRPRVAGTIDQLRQFIAINNLDRSQIIIPDHLNDIKQELGENTTRTTISTITFPINKNITGPSGISTNDVLINNSNDETTVYQQINLFKRNREEYSYGPNQHTESTPIQHESVNLGKSSSYESSSSSDQLVICKSSFSSDSLSSPNRENDNKRAYNGRKKMDLTGSTNDIIENYPTVKLEETIINLSRKKITIKGSKWYNLETSRQTGNINNRIFFVSPRVVGTIELLTQFVLINELDMNKVIISGHLKYLREKVDIGIINRKPRIIACDDIDKISNDEIDRLQPFRFANITIPARITYIVDGDTFDCAAILDPSLLAIPTPIKVGYRTTIGQTVTMCGSTSKLHSKMLIKLRIRLDGVDAADCIPDSNKKATKTERKQMKGKKEAATEYVRKWANGSNNKIWLQLMGYDCRSRILGKLYQRTSNGHKSKGDLSEHMLRYRHPEYGKVAVPYDGGNKAVAWNN